MERGGIEERRLLGAFPAIRPTPADFSPLFFGEVGGGVGVVGVIKAGVGQCGNASCFACGVAGFARRQAGLQLELLPASEVGEVLDAGDPFDLGFGFLRFCGEGEAKR